MTDIIDFAKAREERSPHVAGEAFCLGCDHTWAAVLPYDTDVTKLLECPACRRVMGRFKYEFAPDGGSLFTCHCGNQLFNVTEKYRLFCPRCAVQTNLSDLP